MGKEVEVGEGEVEAVVDGDAEPLRRVTRLETFGRPRRRKRRHQRQKCQSLQQRQMMRLQRHQRPRQDQKSPSHRPLYAATGH